MVMIGILSYPTESVKEFVKRYLEQPPLPAYITMRGPYGSAEVRKGIEAITIYEFDQSKFQEASQAIGARYTRYYGVPGFTYSVKPWIEAAEAIKIMGMGQKSKAK